MTGGTTDAPRRRAWDVVAGGRLVLAVDASTYVGTVAVLRDGAVLAERETAMRGADEERLMPAVAAALADAGVAPGATRGALGAVVCGAGPGSFTSLRIAASIAKGLAAASDVGLFAVPSLALLVAGARPPLSPGRWLAALDAMRGDWYVAETVLGDGGAVERHEYFGIVPAGAVGALVRGRGERGGARLVVPQAQLPAADVHPDAAAAPHARGVAGLGALLAVAGPVDLDAWEPDYGRKAEAQVKWEAAHGRALPTALPAAGGAA